MLAAKNSLMTITCGLLLLLPTAARTQVDFGTRTPLTLFAEMAADTVTNALFNHYTPHPELKFTVVSPAPGVDLTGATTVLIALDFNNDGFEDVFQGNHSFPGEEFSKLLINQGDGSFLPLKIDSMPIGIVGGAAGDLDNDGWTDLVLVSVFGGHRVGTWRKGTPEKFTTRLSVFHNRQGRALATPEVLFSGAESSRATIEHPVLMDFNQDSYLDLAVIIRQDEGESRLMVWYGAPGGVTMRAKTQYKIRGTARPIEGPHSVQDIPLLATADYDHDGDQDLLLQDSGYLPYRPRYLRVMINDIDSWRDPVEVPVPAVSRQTPPILADFDNDGRFEYFFGDSDFDGGRSALCVQDSSGHFVDRGKELGLWVGYNYTRTAVWADLNNDGWLDLVQSLSNNEGAWTQSTIYLNEAGAFFSNVSRSASPDLGPGSRAAVALDADHDGDLDLILGHGTDYADVTPLSETGLDLVKNESETGNWLTVKLEGTVSNRSALGALIELHTGSSHMLQAVPNGVFWGTSQPSTTAHFGLADRTAADSLVVVWPNGVRENFGPQAANKRVILREGSAETGSGKSRDPDHP